MMKRFLILLSTVLGFAALAQPIPQTTAFMRSIMLSTNAAHARSLLGVAYYNEAATIVVDGANGSDTTGARGTAKPYATWDAAVAAHQAGDLILIRPGTYLTTGSDGTSRTIKSNVFICGSGIGNTSLILTNHNTNATTRVLSTQTTATGEATNAGGGITIRDLTVDANATAVGDWGTSGKCTVMAIYGPDVTIERVHGKGQGGHSGQEAFGIMAGYGTNALIADCIVTDVDSVNSLAFLLVGAAHSKIRDCIVPYTTGTAFGGAYLGTDCEFVRCVSPDNGNGLNLDTGATNSNMSLIDCYLKGSEGGSSITGIRVLSTSCTNLTIRGCFVAKYVSGLILTNAGTGGYDKVFLQNNHIRSPSYLHYITNLTATCNRTWVDNVTVGSCVNVMGLDNKTQAGVDIAALLSDARFDDLTVAGTLTATNAALLTPTITGAILADVEDTSRFLTLDASSEIVQSGSSSWLSLTLDDETGSGLLVFNISPNITNPTLSGTITVGTQPGIAATVDVLTSASSTNRLVWVGGILVSNIADYNP